ncbi:MAG: signal peptidase I [Oscillospiraceae bacterium]|nr:signal peptidase I [Oscillospiraceae bacterium]
MEPSEQINQEKNPQEKLTWQQSIVLYLNDLTYMLIAIVLVFLLLFRVIVVSGDSMKQTLIDGDYLLLLSNVFYREPQPGDIIVASKDSYDNGSAIIKRVIATEGQIVDIDFEHGIVYVDGLPLEEPYINNLTTRQEGILFPLIVEEGCIFVLGDNRDVSKDSRHPEIGLIDTREVLGKALFLMVPGVDEETEHRDFDRTGAIR